MLTRILQLITEFRKTCLPQKTIPIFDFKTGLF